MNWLSTDTQAHIEPPQLPLIKSDEEAEKSTNITEINMQQSSTSYALETYALKMDTFENGQPHDFLKLLKNFTTAINKNGTTNVAGQINYIRTMLCGEA